MLRFTLLEILIIIAVGVLVVSMIIRLFLHEGGANKVRNSLDPYNDDFDSNRRSIRRKGELILEVDEEDEIIEKPKTFDDVYEQMKKRKRLNLIIGVLLLIAVGISFYFIFHVPKKDLVVLYAGKFNITNDYRLRRELMQIDGIEKTTVKVVSFDEKDENKYYEAEGKYMLDTILEENGVDVYVIDEYFLSELKDRFAVLDDYIQEGTDRERLVIKKGQVLACDVSGDERIVKGFSEYPDKIYIAVAASADNLNNAMNYLKFYLKVVE